MNDNYMYMYVRLQGNLQLLLGEIEIARLFSIFITKIMRLLTQHREFDFTYFPSQTSFEKGFVLGCFTDH